MLRRYRQRRGPYSLAAPSPVPSFLRSAVLLLIALVVLYYIGRSILHLFGIGGSAERTPVTLMVENHSAVNVSLEGSAMQRADDSLKLYAGDKVSVGANAHARLTFFDKSWTRTDSSTDASIDASTDVADTAEFELNVTKGSVFVRTPTVTAFSGSVTRTVVFPTFTLKLPADTQAYADASTLIVFSADGNGVSVLVNGSKDAVFIGEGQQLNLPVNPEGDVYKYRSAIDPLAVQKPFVRESRSLGTSPSTTLTGSGTAIEPTALLLTSPTEGSVVSTDSVKVIGKIGSKVDSVRVNGHQATIDRLPGTFATELAFNDSLQMEVQVQAMDSNGIVINEVTRNVKKTATQIPTVTITSPAGNGQTYRTEATQVEIKGTAPAGVAGIVINDYKLQLFRKGDTTWSYLASDTLKNLLPGQNNFSIYALDDQGRQGPAATIIILISASGPVGIVNTGSTVSASSAPEQADENTLPQNAPLSPGVITVTSPQAGSSFTATGSEIIIAGTTSSATDSIWINGYKLRLFKAGKTTWNYIANTTYGTLKKGTNVYKIHARNKENQLLDSFEYTVTY